MIIHENILNKRKVTDAPIRLPRTTSHMVWAFVTILLCAMSTAITKESIDAVKCSVR